MKLTMSSIFRILVVVCTFIGGLPLLPREDGKIIFLELLLTSFLEAASGIFSSFVILNIYPREPMPDASTFAEYIYRHMHRHTHVTTQILWRIAQTPRVRARTLLDLLFPIATAAVIICTPFPVFKLRAACFLWSACVVASSIAQIHLCSSFSIQLLDGRIHIRLG